MTAPNPTPPTPPTPADVLAEFIASEVGGYVEPTPMMREQALVALAELRTAGYRVVRHDPDLAARIDEAEQDPPDFDGYLPREAWEAAFRRVRALLDGQEDTNG